MIKRLIILHCKLYEISNGCFFLPDVASDAELTEHVLYFSNSEELPSCGGPSSSAVDYERIRLKDLIEFSSLCTAVLSLPGALDPAAGEEVVKEVHFDNSSLAFQVIEEPKIVAVAEIARHSCSAAAVRAALNRSHVLFSLLRGGGIDLRLRQPVLDQVHSSDERYPGMRGLYELLKRQRQMSQSVPYKLDDPDLSSALEGIEGEVRRLRESLTIDGIRGDLKLFYDTFLTDYSSIESLGTGRNMIEKLPAAFSRRHSIFVADAQIEPQLLHLLSNELSSGEGGSGIVAVSAFVNGLLTATVIEPNVGIALTSEILVLLMEYLSSFRSKMSTGATCHEMNNISKMLRSFPLSLGETTDQAETAFEPSGPDSEQGFLSPPPLSWLSPSDDMHMSFEGPGGRKVWAPAVALPSDGGIMRARICLYFDKEVSYLLLLLPALRSKEIPTSYAQLFDIFVRRIESSTLSSSLTTPRVEDSCLHLAPENGCEIVFVDKNKCTVMVILSFDINHEKNSLTEGTRSPRFFRLHRTNETRGHVSELNSKESLKAESRYVLASQLPSDTLLAFDDAMTAMHSMNAGPGQLLTSLAQKWIYACVDGTKELYASLDAKTYVTVADVQYATAQVRGYFFNQKTL